MANTKSAKKANRKAIKRTQINKARVSRVRTHIRAVEEAVKTGDAVKAKAAMKAAEPEIMRSASKGLTHKRTASRKVSRLVASVKKLSA